MKSINFYGIDDLSDLKGKTLLFTPKLDLSGIDDQQFLERHYEKYAYIPSRILTSLATDKRLEGNPSNFTSIYSGDICKHLTTRFYTKIIDDLVNGNVIH